MSAPRTRWSTGQLDDQFVLDIFQTGSGTSTNTNANEVIADAPPSSSMSTTVSTPTTT